LSRRIEVNVEVARVGLEFVIPVELIGLVYEAIVVLCSIVFIQPWLKNCASAVTIWVCNRTFVWMNLWS